MDCNGWIGRGPCDMSAVGKHGDADLQQPVPDAEWSKFQSLKRAHARRTSDWRHEWEVAFYRKGDLRKGKPLEKGATFFRHIACRAECGTSNLPRTHKEHKCEMVGGGVTEAMQ